jgi:Flp pilus assembly protein TadD
VLSVFSASNTLSDDEALRALFDRFLLRCHVDQLRRDAMPQLLAAGWALEQTPPPESSVAAAELRELSRRDPTNAEALYDLGLALKQQDDFDGAAAAFRDAARLDPALPEAPFTLGVVLWQTGRADEAVAAFRDAIARRADYADAHYMLATVLKQQGQNDAALEEVRQTIRLNPRSPEAHTTLAQLLQENHDADGARAALAEAERLNREKADAQASVFAVNAGINALKKPDIPAAIAKFREAIRLAPDNAQAHFQLALALRRVGKQEESRAEFATAKRLAPYLRSPQ